MAVQKVYLKEILKISPKKNRKILKKIYILVFYYLVKYFLDLKISTWSHNMIRALEKQDKFKHTRNFQYAWHILPFKILNFYIDSNPAGLFNINNTIKEEPPNANIQY